VTTLNGITSLNSSNDTIGGTTPAARNLVASCGFGVELTGSGAQVQGNFIGTDAGGTSALGNLNNGVLITDAASNTVGGTDAGAGNVISGNSQRGVEITGDGATANVVQGNLIGVDAAGSAPLANALSGVVLTGGASGNSVGGAVGNTIAHNGARGVSITDGDGASINNAVLGNSIFANGALGIDLGNDGVTANDQHDADDGPDRLQNFPALTFAVDFPANLNVAGSLDSAPDTDFTIQLFSNPACDPTGSGEGQTLLTSFHQTTNDSGKLVFTVLIANVAVGQFVTATATDPAGNTSEFSQCVQVTSSLTPTPTPPPTSSFEFGQADYSVFEDCTTVALSVTRAGDTSTPASVDYATQAATANDRSDFNTAIGTLSFAPGETSKTFDVLINEDSITEGDESFTVALSNPTGAALGTQATATVGILDDPPEPAVNAIDDASDFVGQHYHDFLNRQSDTAGLDFWANQIEACGSNSLCRDAKRVNVSAAFFLSIEFQETGGFAIRTQRAAFGKKSADASTRVTYRQFIRDARQLGEGVVVGQPGFDQRLEANKQAYTAQLVASTDFAARYPASQTADQYVDALFASAGVTPTADERQAAINAFGGGGSAGRVAALRSVSDSDSLRAAEFAPSFVLMQYFGYLRRNPTDAPDASDAGYQFWLSKLEQFGGDFQKAEMVRAFILSTEYRSRFGQP
jgi:Calx-beta domain/Domain of unknown function (DUF4214)